MLWDTYDMGERICNYITSGNTTLLKILFDCGFLQASDTFDPTGQKKHGSSEESISLLHILARNGSPKYQEIIDILLKYGVDKYSESSLLEEAIQYQNTHIAKYLYLKSSRYSENIPENILEKLR